MKRASLVSLVVVLAAAAVAAGILSRAGGRAPAAPEATEASTPRVRTFQAMRSAGNAAIYVEDQPAGASVVSVGFAIMPNAGYVEIRADEDGHPGATVGASRPVPSGGAEHVLVDLDVPLEAHAIYYALLVDEGRTPVTDAEGNIVLMSFAALPGAEPETEAVEP